MNFFCYFFFGCKYANRILPVLKVENEVGTDGIYHIFKEKLGHLLQPSFLERGELCRRGGHGEVFPSGDLSQRRFETWNFYFSPCCFLYRHLLNGSLYFISKTHCWHCPNTSQQSILSFLRGNNNILCMSGVQVIFSAYLHFVFSRPAVNSFTLYWGTN